jgi:small subunit ribosomal protein S1
MEESVAAPDRLEVKQKTYFKGRVTKIALAGALLDLGGGQFGAIHISQMVAPTDQPIKRVEDVLQIGTEVDVWVKKVKDDRVELTMIKPLDLEWKDIKKGMNVKGKVVRLEKFGAFVEIGAERPGLVHISEMAHGYVKQPSDVVNEGDEIEAQVLDFNRRKKQIKLSMKALLPEPVKVEEPTRSVEFQPRERPVAAARRPKKAPRRKNEDGMSESVELLANMQEPAPVEAAEPTAMEIALREAMERAKTKKKAAEEKTRKAKVSSQEQEDLLARTLEQKARSS